MTLWSEQIMWFSVVTAHQVIYLITKKREPCMQRNVLCTGNDRTNRKKAVDPTKPRYVDHVEQNKPRGLGHVTTDPIVIGHCPSVTFLSLLISSNANALSCYISSTIIMSLAYICGLRHFIVVFFISIGDS